MCIEAVETNLQLFCWKIITDTDTLLKWNMYCQVISKIDNKNLAFERNYNKQNFIKYGLDILSKAI